MTKTEQMKLLAEICDRVRDDLLTRAEKWPQEWDGHELRELVAMTHQHERTNLMRENTKRRNACKNDIIVNNL